MMRYLPTGLLLSVLAASAEGSHVKRLPDGGLELDLDLNDLKELPEKLAEAINPNHPPKRRLLDRDLLDEVPESRIFGLGDGSDVSLLNQLIGFFMPHVNNLFHQLVPDPFPAPVHGRVQIPQIDLFGYCTADAGFDVNFGTLRGLSGVNIERLQVIPRTESIRPGWNVVNGCFETAWSAIFDIAISGVNALVVDDMHAGIFGQACNYEFDEEISGGIETMAPRIRGALNISGVLSGNLARIANVDVAHSLDIGYDDMQAFVNNAPTSVNQAVRNITSRLSQLAREELLTFLVDDQLSNNVAPNINQRMYEGMQNQEITMSATDALQLSAGFVSNGARRQIEGFANSVGDVLGNFGFEMGVAEDEDQGIVGGMEGPSLGDQAVGGAVGFLEDAAKFLSGVGFELGEEEEVEDQGIIGGMPSDGESNGIVPQEVLDAATDLFKATQQHVIQGAANFLNGGEQANAASEEGTEEGVEVVTEDSLQAAAENAAGAVAEAVANSLSSLGLGAEQVSAEDGSAADGESMGILPEVWTSAQNLWNSFFNGGGGARRLRGN